MQINKRKSLIIPALFIFAIILTILFLIFSFIHPTLHLTKASGFSQKDLNKESNKLRFVVPDTIDTTKTTYISIKKEWFESSGLGKITEIKAKPGKYLALNFTDRQYDSEVFTIYTKNWFGIKKQHDVIVDYSNYLRVFFPESYDGAVPRKPIILPYSKLETDYRAKLEELRQYDSFFAYDKKGLITSTAVRKEEVFNKQNAQGRAFIVNNNTRISLIYDFVLPGIFKNQTQKTQVYEQVEKAVGKAKTYDPAKQGLEIKFNTPPFYITKFLGWYYTDPAGNRVDLLPGQEFQIPTWVKSELRLIAKYEMTTDTSKLGPALDKQGLVSVSYFDGPERVFFDIVRKGTLLKERVYAKPGYAYQGWYTDPELTNKVDFKKDIADTHTVLYLKSKERPETPAQTHTVNFITKTKANQLLPLSVRHGEKLDTNYSLPTTVSYLDNEGDLHELDYWNIVDPITGTKTRFDFSTPITEDITLEAVLKKRLIPNSKYTIKRYFESLEHQGEFIEDLSKQEELLGQVPGQEVELLPHQYKAPEGFNLLSSAVLKKTIERDGSTTFELKYVRNRYTVTYEVNYNGNHFKNVNASTVAEQTVLHEGKATKPSTPTLTRVGYTYTFKHWQLKDEMGNVYKEVSEFNFNTKITKNLTLVAYFEEKAESVNYTINHVLPGLNGAVGETKPEIKQATADTSLTIDENNANPAYFAGFEPIANSETKKIEADGSTVFTINYRRRKFTVTYEVNYLNHFEGTPSVQNPETVEYEANATQPPQPTITKYGRTYLFKHWQLESSMNGVYSEQTAYDFANQKVTGNISLVAYFEEIINRVTYYVVHWLEKEGKSASLNGQYEKVSEIKSDQKVEDGATYHDFAQLSSIYEKDTTHPKNKLYSQLTPGDHSVEVCQYYKIKEVEVRFKKTAGIDSLQYETLKVKKTRSVPLPTYTLKDTHNFVGWALTESGQTQGEFVIEKNSNGLEIYALTDYQDREITYTIRKENTDGTFDESEEKKTGKIASSHTVSYANPDSSVYQNPTYSASSLLVNADKNQNKAVITLLRKTYQVTFEVIDSSGDIPTRTIRHGATIGKIDESQIAPQGLVIQKAELDDVEMTKEEIEKFVVLKNHNVLLYIGIPTRKFGKYPQTVVYNPQVDKIQDVEHELKFNSKGKDYTMKFTRSHWQDKKGNKYEKYNGHYYKFESVDFVRIPEQNTWYTEKIIDFSPFNLYYDDYRDNAKPERSIFKAMVKDIGKVLGGDVYMPTYDSGEFSVLPAVQKNLTSQLKKEATPYAQAVLNQQIGTTYRGADLSSFAESGVKWLSYNIFLRNRWWLGAQFNSNYANAHNLNGRGSGLIDYSQVHNVFGVVVCIR